ncbi:hypothetical protein [Psychroserpens sp.]|uniref:hypothetical protein n=1 Tax=Psychroserpens sp. TaxID=2020870 RepID=UPI00385ECED3
MKATIKFLCVGLILISCKTGNLDVLADLPSSLKETSAIEKTVDSDLLWVIEDSGNSNHIYGLDLQGKIVKDVTVSNSENIDWEDLTSDSNGNIYIGDFGNNDEDRTKFTIYKISNIKNTSNSKSADLIQFTLPENLDSIDFESFFLHKGFFYIFSKDNKVCDLIKVPNKIGQHEAIHISKIELEGKHNKVTSADISENGKTVVLLNHNKLWKLTDYTNDDFFSGTIKVLKFDHDSQKEGINFINDNQVLITDERNKFQGGNIYRFDIK